MLIIYVFYIHFCISYVDHTIIVYRLYVFKKKNNNNFVNKISTSKTTTCCIDDEWKCVVEMHKQPPNRLLGEIVNGNVAMEPTSWQHPLGQSLKLLE